MSSSSSSSPISSAVQWNIKGPYDGVGCGFSNLRADMGEDNDFIVELEDLLGFSSVSVRQDNGTVVRHLVAQYLPGHQRKVCGPGAGWVLAGTTVEREAEILAHLNQIVDAYWKWSRVIRLAAKAGWANRIPTPKFPSLMHLTGEWTEQEATALFVKRGKKRSVGALEGIHEKPIKIAKLFDDDDVKLVAV